ncbi:hypothetical protein D3C79_1028880 [compost metagenome]
MHARFITSGIEIVGDDPGLQSVEIATGTPASIKSLARAGFSPRYNAVVGNKHAMTPEFASA